MIHPGWFGGSAGHRRITKRTVREAILSDSRGQPRPGRPVFPASRSVAGALSRTARTAVAIHAVSEGGTPLADVGDRHSHLESRDPAGLRADVKAAGCGPGSEGRRAAVPDGLSRDTVQPADSGVYVARRERYGAGPRGNLALDVARPGRSVPDREAPRVILRRFTRDTFAVGADRSGCEGVQEGGSMQPHEKALTNGQVPSEVARAGPPLGGCASARRQVRVIDQLARRCRATRSGAAAPTAENAQRATGALMWCRSFSAFPGTVQRVPGARRHVAWYVRWQTGGSGARQAPVVARDSVLAAPAATAQRGRHISIPEPAQALGEPGEPPGTRLSQTAASGAHAPTHARGRHDPWT